MILAKKLKWKDFVLAIYRTLYIKSYWNFGDILPAISYPHIVGFELTNHCNFSCIHCHRRIIKRPSGYMDLNLFKKIIEELSDNPFCFVRLVGQGEPSVHPKIKEILTYLAGKPIKSEITTNGTLFVLFTPEEILSFNLDIIGISVDGFDKVSYEKIRKNGNYDSLKHNIENFYQFRNKQKRKYPIINIRNVILPNSDQKEILAFIKTWEKLSDYITFNTFIPSDKFVNKSRTFNRCQLLFFHALVRWDGNVPLCGYRFLSDYEECIGNLNNETFAEIWKCRRLKDMRLHHKNLNLNKIEFCNNCFYIQTKDQEYANKKKYDYSRNALITLINRFHNIT